MIRSLSPPPNSLVPRTLAARYAFSKQAIEGSISEETEPLSEKIHIGKVI
jgi:hypothetical protein